VKLRNVLFDPEQHRLKLVDFGIARILENYGRGASGQTLREFYSRPFAAPEQVLQKDTSFPADLYAFGVLLASLLAWRLPEPGFDADTLATSSPRSGLSTPTRKGSPRSRRCVRGLLRKDPAARPKAAEVERALRTALDGLVERTPVRVILTNTPRQRAREFGAEDEPAWTT
jgi:serine/threonine protein kinase